MAYPEYRAIYAGLSVICIAVAGMISGISGGMLAEKFGVSDPRNYARICILGSLLALFTQPLSTLVSSNFWVSIILMAARYLLGGGYYSPNLTMI